MEYSQSRAITETLVNLNQIHDRKSATVGCCAARDPRLSFPALCREALCPLGGQNQVEILAGSFRVYDWILRNDTAVILHFHSQTIVR